MDANTFYGSKKLSTKRGTTLAETQMEAEDCENRISMIVLPPCAGAQLIDSDVEDVLEGLNEEFEPAGELEVEFEDMDETLSDSSVVLSEHLTIKIRRVCSQLKWHKKYEFDDVLPSVLPKKINQHPELIILSCLQLRRDIFTDEISTLIVNQTIFDYVFDKCGKYWKAFGKSYALRLQILF